MKLFVSEAKASLWCLFPPYIGKKITGSRTKKKWNHHIWFADFYHVSKKNKTEHLKQKWLVETGIFAVHQRVISLHSRHLRGEIASFLKLELCPADWLIVERAINFPLCLEGLPADVQLVGKTGLWGDSVHGVVRKSRAPWRTAVAHAIVAAFAVVWGIVVF